MKHHRSTMIAFTLLLSFVTRVYAQQTAIRFITGAEQPAQCYTTGIAQDGDGSYTLSLMFEPVNGTNRWVTAVMRMDTAFKIHQAEIIGGDSATDLLQQGFAGAAISTADGGGFAWSNVLQNYSNTTSANLAVLRYNGSGQPVWSKSYDGHGKNNRMSGFLMQPDGTLILLNKRPGYASGLGDQLVALDSLGNVLWSKLYVDTVFDSGVQAAYSGLHRAPDGNIVITGTTQNSQGIVRPYIQKNTPTGQVIWRRSYASTYPGWRVITCLASTMLADGSIAFAVHIATDTLTQLCLIKVDRDGNIQRSVMAWFAENTVSLAMTQLKSGNIVLGMIEPENPAGIGTLEFFEFLSDWTLVQSSYLSNPRARALGQMMPLADSGLLAEATGADEQPIILKLDSNLGVCGAQRYPLWFRSIDFVTVDSTVEVLDSTPAVLVKSDFVPSRPTIFGSLDYCSQEQVGTAAVSAGQGITLYPNPVSSAGNGTVLINGVTAGRYVTSIIDALGRTVHRTPTTRLNSPTNTLALSCKNLAAGRYVVRVVDADSQKQVADIPLVIVP